MRKLLFMALPLVAFGSVALAQAKPAAMAQAKPAAMGHKVNTKWHCQKASDQHQVDAGDMAGHSYGIAQGACDATSGGSLGEKTGQYTESQEMWTGSMKSHGVFISTLDNGDKINYTYTFSGSTDSAKPMSNRWRIVTGTGTHKGIKGSGSCSGKSNAADGSVDWACMGSYWMGK
jgi:hypothetical protein